jgi:hypothetical protein
MFSAVKSVGQRSWGAPKPTEANTVAKFQAGAAHGASGDAFDARNWWGIASKLIKNFGWSVTPEAYQKLMSYNFPNFSVDKSKIKESSKSFEQNVKSRIVSIPPLAPVQGPPPPSTDELLDTGGQLYSPGVDPGVQVGETSPLLKYGLPLGIGIAFILGGVFILRK